MEQLMEFLKAMQEEIDADIRDMKDDGKAGIQDRR
jgi:hypothetical protein